MNLGVLLLGGGGGGGAVVVGVVAVREREKEREIERETESTAAIDLPSLACVFVVSSRWAPSFGKRLTGFRRRAPQACSKQQVVGVGANELA